MEPGHPPPPFPPHPFPPFPPRPPFPQPHLLPPFPHLLSPFPHLLSPHPHPRTATGGPSHLFLPPLLRLTRNPNATTSGARPPPLLPLLPPLLSPPSPFPPSRNGGAGASRMQMSVLCVGIRRRIFVVESPTLDTQWRKRGANVCPWVQSGRPR